MSSSLQIVSLKTNSSQSHENDKRDKLATSEIHQIHMYNDYLIFTNSQGIYKASKEGTNLLHVESCKDVSVMTGSDRLFVTSSDSSLFSLSSTNLTPVPLPSYPVRQVACGREHGLALLQHGVVVAWGRGPQMGLGDLVENMSAEVTDPLVIPGLKDVISVSAGAFHSAAVLIGGGIDGGESETEGGASGDSGDLVVGKLKVRVGASSFLFAASAPDRRRDFNILEKFRNVRRWSESIGNEDGRRHSIASVGIYEQLAVEEGLESASTTPSGSTQSDLYIAPENADSKSLPGLSQLELDLHSNMRDLSVDTEVWTWGMGKSGQLGLTHSDDVNRPTRLINLPAVVKVTCGFSHTLALTADSKVYIWGTYQKARRALVPQLIDTNSCLVFDVAAGNCVSVLVGYITHRPDVFVLDKNRVPVRMTELRQEGWPVVPTSTFAAPLGDAHCLVSTPGSIDESNLFEATHGLNFKLRTLFSHLHNLKLSFESFIHICTMDEDTTLSSRLILLINSVSVLHRTTHACVNLMTQRCLSSISRPWTRPSEIAYLARSLACQLDSFIFFIHKLSNAVAWNTFETMVRLHPVACTESLSGLQTAPNPQSGPQKANAIREAFYHLRELVLDVHIQISILDSLCPEFGSGLPSSLSKTATAELFRKTEERFKEAEETCVVVQTLPHSVQSQLSSTPGRRVVRESESSSLSISNKNGRSSSGQRIILFTDSLAVISGSQITAWPLSLVWIRGNKEVHEEKLENGLDAISKMDMNDAENSFSERRASLKGSSFHSFQVLMPDEILTLYAPNEAVRAEWFSAINTEIKKTFPNYRPAVSQMAPERRFGQFTFRTGALRGCRYDGQWMWAMMHGDGHLTWPDGSQHRGRFRRGKISGPGTRELKSPSRVQTGTWEDGMLHGFAKVTYDEEGLKSEYEGWFTRGVRQGHGVLRSDGGYIYIGEWLQDKQDGYGVEEDYSAYPQYRYFGEWKAGLKHGRGSMVTLTNKYMEGPFVEGEMRGQGRITDADFVFTGKIINGKPNGEGQCIFKSASGCVKLNGKCFGLDYGKLKFEGEVEIKTESEVISMNRQSVYRYQTEDVDPNAELPCRWRAILRHCKHLLGQEEGKEEFNEDRIRETAWTKLASIISVAKKRWEKGQRLFNESEPRTSAQPRWAVLEQIPNPSSSLSLSYISQAREYLLSAVDVAEHPLGIYLSTMVSLIKEAYLGMGTHPQLLRHAREDVWIAADGMYSLLRLLFPLLPAYLDDKVLIDDAGERQDELCSVHFVGRDFVYAVLLPRVFPVLRTLYSTTLDAEEDAYRLTIKKFSRKSDSELFTLLEISSEFRERLVSEYDVVGGEANAEPHIRYSHIVEKMQVLNSEDVCSPIEQLSVLMRAYDGIVELIRGPNQRLTSADDQVPVILFILIRARITHLGATLAFIRDMTAFSCDCTRGAVSYKFTTILGLYRHLVDRNGALY